MTDKEKLRNWLNSKRITKTEFAEKTGISTSFLYSGKSFSIENLKKILECYPDYADELLVDIFLNRSKDSVEEPRSLYGLPKNQLEEKERAIVYLENHINDKEKIIQLQETKIEFIEKELNAMKRRSPKAQKNS